MPQIAVDARGDQLMRRRLGTLDNMIKIGPRGNHGAGADGLAQDHEAQAEEQQGAVPDGREPLAVREEVVRQAALDDGGGVGDVIGGAVLRQQERGDLGGARVVAGGGPELEEVEEREDADEEGHAPEGRVSREEEVQGEAQRERQRAAEDK